MHGSCAPDVLAQRKGLQSEIDRQADDILSLQEQLQQKEEEAQRWKSELHAARSSLNDMHALLQSKMHEKEFYQRALYELQQGGAEMSVPQGQQIATSQGWGMRSHSKLMQQNAALRARIASLSLPAKSSNGSSITALRVDTTIKSTPPGQLEMGSKDSSVEKAKSKKPALENAKKKDKGRVRKVKKKTKKKKVMRKKKIKRKKRGSSSSSVIEVSLRTPVPKPEYDIFDPQFQRDGDDGEDDQDE